MEWLKRALALGAPPHKGTWRCPPAQPATEAGLRSHIRGPARPPGRRVPFIAHANNSMPLQGPSQTPSVAMLDKSMNDAAKVLFCASLM